MTQVVDRDALAAVLADATAGADDRLRAWNGLWPWLLLGDDPARAASLAVVARAVAEEHGRIPEAIGADVVTAESITSLPGPKAEALRLAEEAAAEAEAFGEPALAARARVAYGHALVSVGAYHLAIDTLLDAKEALRSLGDAEALAWADVRMTPALLGAGEPASARRTAERVLAWADSHGGDLLAANARVPLASVALAEGDIPRAKDEALHGREQAVRLGLGLLAAQADIVLGYCALAGSDAASAASLFEQAQRSLGDQPALLVCLGQSHHLVGRDDLAAGELARAVDLAVAEGRGEVEYRARYLLATIAAAAGDADEASRQEGLAREVERGHHGAWFDQRVADVLTGFEAERSARESRSERDRRG